MVKSSKFAAVAGVLGGLALIGAGSVQAFGAEDPDNCVEDEKGTIRCVQVSEQEITTDQYGKIHFVNNSKQTCSGENAEVSCTNSVVLPDEKS
ncbi:hypothetical protein [Streptomyces prasinopilosus]|uniref:Uncharacterized protein n=1 Tax=Streptomyces prasinopilosus TaxID=67344 RepID=A0A1G6ILA6_9ACTN|nr:hypothetical protein [Streptomyces prasinopilosus]SDC07211.1 hypothetical protein SAMN05216505_101299 [Streptomyces prasinopilosus]